MSKRRKIFYRLLTGILALAPLFAANKIQSENQKQGTDAWKISDPAANHEIEGYASATSIDRGDSIVFYVNTAELLYNISVYRVGWYDGAGGRLVANAGFLLGRVQRACPQDSASGLIECNWTPSYTLNVPNNPNDWTSGIYLAKLTGIFSGKQSYIIFVVRDDNRPSDIYFQSSVTTYQAYNGWGGRSLYSFNSTPSQARKVSFNRPYAEGVGSGEFYYGWEINMLRFLEREGYDVTYFTDIDTHRDPSLILKRKAFLSVGHDEYWSWQMRNGVEQARDSGVSLGFFGSNAAYWQIRLDPSPATGAAYRTIVCYKQFAPAEDPYYNDPVNRHLTTVRFRDAPLNRPEAALIGVMQDDFDNQFIDVDMIIADASNWILAGTGLSNGAALHGLVGYEADRIFTGISPAGTAVIAHSPVRTAGFSDAATYQKGRSTIFAAGTMQWSWGLDDTDYQGHGRISAAVQRMTRNILARFTGDAVAQPANLITAVGPPGSVNSSYNDYAGLQFQTGPVSQTLTQVGLWCQPGDQTFHLVKVTTNQAGHPELVSPVLIRCDGVSGFHYADVPKHVSLNANTTYFLLARGVPFYNPMLVVPSSLATIPNAILVSGSTYTPQSNPNTIYGPLDFTVAQK